MDNRIHLAGEFSFGDLPAQQSHSQHEQQNHMVSDQQQLQVNPHGVGDAAQSSPCESWIVPSGLSSQCAPDWPAVENQMLIQSLPESSVQWNQWQASNSAGCAKTNDFSQNCNKGAISTLQEFVQCSKEFRSPVKRPILKERYEEKISASNLPSFRATVAFLLDGVPHHTVGEWKESKKFAYRDAAERTLELFINRWGEDVLQWVGQDSEQRLEELVGLHQGSADWVEPVETLGKFCKLKGYAPPSWRVTWDGNKCKALAEIRMKDVPYCFDGDAWENEENAYASTAARILHYLACPGFEDFFEFDPAAPAATERELPAPPKNWMGSEQAEQEISAAAQRKGLVVQVQNRLQRMFAKDLKNGESVCKWGECETDNRCPPNFRASLYVPSLDKWFTGSWEHDRKQAQIDTCDKVAKFLDKYEATQKNKSEHSLRSRH